MREAPMRQLRRATATSSGHPPESIARKTTAQSASAVSSSTRVTAARACAMALIAASPGTRCLPSPVFRARSVVVSEEYRRRERSQERTRPGSSRRAMTPRRSTCNAHASAWGASSLAMLPPFGGAPLRRHPRRHPDEQPRRTDLPVSNDFSDTHAVKRTIADASRGARVARPDRATGTRRETNEQSTSR